MVQPLRTMQYELHCTVDETRVRFFMNRNNFFGQFLTVHVDSHNALFLRPFAALVVKADGDWPGSHRLQCVELPSTPGYVPHCRPIGLAVAAAPSAVSVGRRRFEGGGISEHSSMCLLWRPAKKFKCSIVQRRRLRPPLEPDDVGQFMFFRRICRAKLGEQRTCPVALLICDCHFVSPFVSPAAAGVPLRRATSARIIACFPR